MMTRLYCVGLFLLVAGCGRLPPPEFRFNEVEWLKQQKVHLPDGEQFPLSYRQEVGTVLTTLFGTPNEPRFPFLKAEIHHWGTSGAIGAFHAPHALESDRNPMEVVSLAQLYRAAGPVSSNRQGTSFGLYRANCAHCHGLTGDGAGATATAVQPYPRDFRLGKFKFKSTPLRSPPTDADLTRVIREGIPGTAMPSFRALSDEDVAALVDYVKYLAIRGEFERRLLAELADLDGQPLINLATLREQKTDSASSGSMDNELEEQIFLVVGEWLRDEILPRWTNRDRRVIEVPPPPDSMDATTVEHAALVAQGRQLFYGKANCLQCHGDTGLGDGQQDNYDDWTNEWLKSPGVDPLNRQTFRDFLAAGALFPRQIRPRNLHVPVYRGGGDDATLFRRIAAGIEGTPMPSSPTLSSEEIWALVAYVLALPYEKQSR